MQNLVAIVLSACAVSSLCTCNLHLNHLLTSPPESTGLGDGKAWLILSLASIPNQRPSIAGPSSQAMISLTLDHFKNIPASLRSVTPTHLPTIFQIPVRLIFVQLMWPCCFTASSLLGVLAPACLIMAALSSRLTPSTPLLVLCLSQTKFVSFA